MPPALQGDVYRVYPVQPSKSGYEYRNANALRNLPLTVLHMNEG